MSMAGVGRLQMFHRAMIHPDSLLGVPLSENIAFPLHTAINGGCSVTAWLSPAHFLLLERQLGLAVMFCA
jgi:hypothetical protein